MAITALEILDEGRALLALPKSGRTEARQRTIISRAYYAAYHHLRDHACSQDFNSRAAPGKGLHRQLLDYLLVHPDRNVVYASSLLQRLYADRIHADYNLRDSIAVLLEEPAVDMAGTIIEDVLASD